MGQGLWQVMPGSGEPGVVVFGAEQGFTVSASESTSIESTMAITDQVSDGYPALVNFSFTPVGSGFWVKNTDADNPGDVGALTVIDTPYVDGDFDLLGWKWLLVVPATGGATTVSLYTYFWCITYPSAEAALNVPSWFPNESD